MARVAILLVAFAHFGLVCSSMIESKMQNRHLHKVMDHNRVTIILEGVRTRAQNFVKPDPLVLISYPEINHQFKVICHELGHSNMIRFEKF